MLAALTLMGCTATRPHLQTEARTGYDATTIDVQADADIGVDVFGRSQSKRAYEGNRVHEAAYAGVSKSIVLGIGPVVEGHLRYMRTEDDGHHESELERTMRAGIETHHHIGDFELFSTVTSRVDRLEQKDFEAWANARYGIGNINMSLEGEARMTHGEYHSSRGLASATYGNWGFIGPFYEIDHEHGHHPEHNAGIVFGLRMD